MTNVLTVEDPTQDAPNVYREVSMKFEDYSKIALLVLAVIVVGVFVQGWLF